MSVNSQVVQLFRDSVNAVIDAVVNGHVRSARIRFTAVDGPQFNNFWWISVDMLEGGRLWLRTNDIDLMVGEGPSFHAAAPVAEGERLLEEAVSFLTAKQGTSSRVEILLQSDAPEGKPAIPNFVGNSVDGFGNLQEQQIPDVF